jgi:hypothetical protein
MGNTMSRGRPTQHQRFVNWWTRNAEQTAEATATKCAEYGSQDLYGIGQNVARLAGRDIERDAAFELGCLFYMLGKIERAMSAVERGETASDDTWFDLHVYANMVLAHRAGVWMKGQPK